MIVLNTSNTYPPKWASYQIFDTHIEITIKKQHIRLTDAFEFTSTIIITAKYTKTRINGIDGVLQISDLWDIDHGSLKYLGKTMCDAIRQSVNASLVKDASIPS